MAYKYKTQGFIEKGVDFAAIFADKQKDGAGQLNLAYGLPEGVAFLKKQSEDFTRQDQHLMDIDAAIARIVGQYEKVMEAPKVKEAKDLQPKPPYEAKTSKGVSVISTPKQVVPDEPVEEPVTPVVEPSSEIPLQPVVEAPAVVEPVAVAEPAPVAKPEPTQQDLKDKIETLEMLLEMNPDDEDLKDKIDTLKDLYEMEYGEPYKLENGGDVIDFARPQIGAIQTIRLEEGKYEKGGNIDEKLPIFWTTPLLVNLGTKDKAQWVSCRIKEYKGGASSGLPKKEWYVVVEYLKPNNKSAGYVTKTFLVNEDKTHKLKIDEKKYYDAWFDHQDILVQSEVSGHKIKYEEEGDDLSAAVAKAKAKWDKLSEKKKRELVLKHSKKMYAEGGGIYESGKAVDNAVKQYIDDILQAIGTKTTMKLYKEWEHDNNTAANWLLLGYAYNAASKEEIEELKKLLSDNLSNGFLTEDEWQHGYKISKKYYPFFVEMAEKMEGYVKKEKGGEVTDKVGKFDVAEVLKHYMIAALWSSNDYDAEGEPPFDDNYSIEDIDPATGESMRMDVIKFLNENKEALEKSGLPDEQIGHDFWLSRNGHGAGFFDRKLDDDVEKKLMDSAKAFKECNLYAENGKVKVDPINKLVKTDKPAATGFSAHTDEWFDELVEYIQSEKELDPNYHKLVELAHKEATKANLEKFEEIMKACSCSKPELKAKILSNINKVLGNEYKKEFKHQFGGKAKKAGKVSAASSFFDIFLQAVQYNSDTTAMAEGGGLNINDNQPITLVGRKEDGKSVHVNTMIEESWAQKPQVDLLNYLVVRGKITVTDYDSLMKTGDYKIGFGTYAEGGEVKGSNDAKVIVISSKNPLSTQLQKLTGDSYNAIDFEDMTKEYSKNNGGNPQLLKHKKTGKMFVVFTSNYYIQVDDKVIDDDLSWLKKTFGISNIVPLENVKRKEEGGSVDGDGKQRKDTIQLLFENYGFKQKKKAYDVFFYHNEAKNVDASYDTKLNTIEIGEAKLPLSIKAVKKYLDDNGYISANPTAFAIIDRM